MPQDPQTVGPLPVHPDGSLTLKTSLAVPSVLLVHVCAKSKQQPDQVSDDLFSQYQSKFS